MKKNLKSVNIWQSYKQERDCFVHFFRFLECVGQVDKFSAWKASFDQFYTVF